MFNSTCLDRKNARDHVRHAKNHGKFMKFYKDLGIVIGFSAQTFYLF